MKQRSLALMVLFAFSSMQGHATTPVIDLQAIYSELKTARQDYQQQILQANNQQQQIVQQVKQLRQMDHYLELLGDPSKVKIDTLKELYSFIRKLPVSRSSKEMERILEDDYLFVKQGGYGTVSREITVDGVYVDKRDASDYRPELVARKAVADYHDLKSEVIEQRQDIDYKLQRALRDLEAANTASEVKKIQVTISALNAQRAALTKEIDVAASEATTRYIQNEVEERIARKAHDQEQRARLKIGIRKKQEMYVLPSSPTLFKR